MREVLQNLKEDLKQNWTYLHKILFTFSFYLLYKAFLKVLSPETMSPYILIFIIIGFLIFTIDTLIHPISDLAPTSTNPKLEEKKKVANIIVYMFLGITIVATTLYYIYDYYPIVSIITYSLIMAVLSYSFFYKYKTLNKTRIIKTSIAILSIVGIAAIIHSFYLNVKLNINSFMLAFVLGFFILDFFINSWKKPHLQK